MNERIKPLRRRRLLLGTTVVLFAVALGLILPGNRGIANWLLLASTFANLMTAVSLRRASARALANER